jgi:hypothetical protein
VPPLDPGKSKAAFSRNVATEVRAGKPQKQAVAIAYREQGEDKDCAARDALMRSIGLNEVKLP